MGCHFALFRNRPPDGGSTKFRCARLTGERQGVRVPRNEGVTNHVSPRAVRRSSRGVRRSVGSGSCGGLLSTEKVLVRGAEAFGLVEGNIAGLVMVSGRRAPRCQRTHARMKAFRRDLGGLHPTSDSVPGSRREDRTVVAGDERGGGVRLGHSSCEVGEQGDESPGGVDGAKDRGQREVNGPKHVPDAGRVRVTQAA